MPGGVTTSESDSGWRSLTGQTSAWTCTSLNGIAPGNRSPGFSLIWWVCADDIVFHYSLKEQVIVGWSRAVGQVAEAPTIWLSHRGNTRRRLRSARAQPGWWLDLDGMFPLDAPVPLGKLRDHADQIRAVLDHLKSRHSGSLYFPFFFWGDNELRPMQPISEQASRRSRRLDP